MAVIRESTLNEVPTKSYSNKAIICNKITRGNLLFYPQKYGTSKLQVLSSLFHYILRENFRVGNIREMHSGERSKWDVVFGRRDNIV